MLMRRPSLEIGLSSRSTSSLFSVCAYLVACCISLLSVTWHCYLHFSLLILISNVECSTHHSEVPVSGCALHYVTAGLASCF